MRYLGLAIIYIGIWAASLWIGWAIMKSAMFSALKKYKHWKEQR